MKNYSLEPTEENAWKLLQKNPIRRNEYVFQFVRLLTHMEDGVLLCRTKRRLGQW